MNSISELQELVQYLMEIRIHIQALTDKLEMLKKDRDSMQSKLLESMKLNRLKAWKNNENAFAIVSKLDTRIVDEEKLIQDIQSRGLVGLVYPRVDSLRFKQIANAMLKETGEMFQGTETINSEYISIRKVS